MSSAKIKKICFIGAGTMGCFNSLLASVAGYECTIYDQSNEVLENRIDSQKMIAQYLTQSNFFNGKDTNAAILKIKNSDNLKSALENTDLVSESIPEDLNLKIKVFNQIETMISKGTILTTNTSTLSIEKISRGLDPNTKFAALHSYLGSKLIDIVKGAHTSDNTVSSLVAYVESIGSMPLALNKEHPGYVVNFMLGGLLTQSLLMVIEDKYTIQEIDAAWKSLNISQVGPFGMMDMFGLDIVKQAWQEKEVDSFHIMHQNKIVKLLSEYTDNSYLGLKTGRGFYNYSNIDFGHEKSNFDKIQNDLCIGIIETAIVLSNREIVDKKQINEAWIIGTTLSKGPFDFLDEIGLVKFLESYEEWVSRDYVSGEFYSIVKNYSEKNL